MMDVDVTACKDSLDDRSWTMRRQQVVGPGCLVAGGAVTEVRDTSGDGF